MGLDINFYKSSELVSPPAGVDLRDWVDEQGLILIDAGIVEYSSLHWPHLPKLTEGVYSSECVGSMPSVPYSTYGIWRNNLAKFAGYGSAENVWDSYKSGPFYELINFSDCEGFIIGPTVSKLHKDFSENKDRIFSLVPKNASITFKTYYEKFAAGIEAIKDDKPIIMFT